MTKAVLVGSIVEWNGQAAGCGGRAWEKAESQICSRTMGHEGKCKNLRWSQLRWVWRGAQDGLGRKCSGAEMGR